MITLNKKAAKDSYEDIKQTMMAFKKEVCYGDGDRDSSGDYLELYQIKRKHKLGAARVVAMDNDIYVINYGAQWYDSEMTYGAQNPDQETDHRRRERWDADEVGLISSIYRGRKMIRHMCYPITSEYSKFDMSIIDEDLEFIPSTNKSLEDIITEQKIILVYNTIDGITYTFQFVHGDGRLLTNDESDELVAAMYKNTDNKKQAFIDTFQMMCDNELVKSINEVASTMIDMNKPFIDALAEFIKSRDLCVFCNMDVTDSSGTYITYRHFYDKLPLNPIESYALQILHDFKHVALDESGIYTDLSYNDVTTIVYSRCIQ
jgi:hypothetical protein